MNMIFTFQVPSSNGPSTGFVMQINTPVGRQVIIAWLSKVGTSSLPFVSPQIYIFPRSLLKSKFKIASSFMGRCLCFESNRMFPGFLVTRFCFDGLILLILQASLFWLECQIWFRKFRNFTYKERASNLICFWYIQGSFDRGKPDT